MNENEKLLSRRNTSAVEQALTQLTTKVYEQEIHINMLQESVSSLMQKINSLEQLLFIHKAAVVGNGPSVK